MKNKTPKQGSLKWQKLDTIELIWHEMGNEMAQNDELEKQQLVSDNTQLGLTANNVLQRKERIAPSVVNGIKGAYNGAKNAAIGTANFARHPMNGLKSGASGIGNGIVNGVTSGINAVRNPGTTAINAGLNTAKGATNGTIGASKLLAKVSAPVALISPLVMDDEGFNLRGGQVAKNIENDVYDERFGGALSYDPNYSTARNMTNFGLKVGLGYVSDVGAGATFGYANRFYEDEKNKQAALQANNQAPQPANNQPTGYPPPSNTQIPQLNEEQAQALKALNAPQNLRTHSIDMLGKQDDSIHIEKPQANYVNPNQAQQALGMNHNPMLQQLASEQQKVLDNKGVQLKQASIPKRSQEEINHRNNLLRDASTVQKGARGLTANQMRMRQDLLSEDAKMQQDRYLQQNNLNHQLVQEQMQQDAQNKRALMGEQGTTARAVMNEQGTNARYAQGFGLDAMRFNESVQNKQQEFGMDERRLGMEEASLSSRLMGEDINNAAAKEQLSLYRQYQNAQSDEERQAIMDNMAALSGKQPSRGNNIPVGKDRYMLVPQEEGGSALFDTVTGQMANAGQMAMQQLDINDPSTQEMIRNELNKFKTAEEKMAWLEQNVPQYADLYRNQV